MAACAGSNSKHNTDESDARRREALEDDGLGILDFHGFYFLKDLDLLRHAPETRKLSETQVFFAPNYVFLSL
jgi:hypothetical protein